MPKVLIADKLSPQAIAVFKEHIQRPFIGTWGDARYYHFTHIFIAVRWREQALNVSGGFIMRDISHCLISLVSD